MTSKGELKAHRRIQTKFLDNAELKQQTTRQQLIEKMRAKEQEKRDA